MIIQNLKFNLAVILTSCHSERSEESIDPSVATLLQDDATRRFYTLKFTFLILFFLGFLFLAALPASAAGLVNCNGPVAGNGLPACTMCNFMQMISDVAFFIVRNVVTPLAGLLFLVGGIIMVSAGGSEERLKKGKEMFKNTAIGVLIILASWAIVNTLITTLGSNVEGFVPGNWWNVKCLSSVPGSGAGQSAGRCSLAGRASRAV